jgi:predicted RNA-binding Zn-ribbon protein involved in translation (DUF1610 family)
MPPDDMPAGTCPECGKTYCVGCRREALDEMGRFTCPDCGKTLKLTDEGLRSLLSAWAKKNIKKKRPKKPKEPVAKAERETPTAETETPAAEEQSAAQTAPETGETAEG